MHSFHFIAWPNAWNIFLATHFRQLFFQCPAKINPLFYPKFAVIFCTRSALLIYFVPPEYKYAILATIFCYFFLGLLEWFLSIDCLIFNKIPPVLERKQLQASYIYLIGWSYKSKNYFKTLNAFFGCSEINKNILLMIFYLNHVLSWFFFFCFINKRQQIFRLKFDSFDMWKNFSYQSTILGSLFLQSFAIYLKENGQVTSSCRQ